MYASNADSLDCVTAAEAHNIPRFFRREALGYVDKALRHATTVKAPKNINIRIFSQPDEHRFRLLVNCAHLLDLMIFLQGTVLLNADEIDPKG